MARPLAIAAALIAALGAVSAPACPEPSAELLFHSCRGAVAPSVLLLPEDPLPAASAGTAWTVTGAYTGTEARPNGAPKPVGLFVHDGRIVNANLARMDGILVIDPVRDEIALSESASVALAGRVYDLRNPEARMAFARAAAEAGLSVLQSHLLIIDGRVDVRPREDAPLFRRRILFTDAHGFGLWQSPGPMTLHDAAERLDADLSPEMALNLDMGSFDYCWRSEGGERRRCGYLGEAETAKLSNLVRFERTGEAPGG